MKTLYKIIVAICFFVNLHIFSWDSTAAKFYPLAVGNSWSYTFKSFGGPFGCTTPASTYNYIVTIVKDTVFNGHKYYKFNNGLAVRIDSSTMNVYKLYGTSDCLTDSLLAKKSDFVIGCPFPMQVIDTSSIFFAGQNRRSIYRGVPGYFRRLLYGIGLSYNGGCDLGTGTSDELNGCIINGIQYGVMLGLNNISNEIPGQFLLAQNYPNPFNPTTNIKFQIPKPGFVKLTIFDVLGKEVQTLVNRELSPGTYSVDFDGSSLLSGVYFYKLETNAFTETKKMVLIK